MPQRAAPSFGTDDKPTAIVDGVGRWWEGQVEGFRWVKSRGVLVRAEGTQKHELHLQSSKWSRSGVGTWVMPRVSVLDDRLREWRRAEATASARNGADTALPIVYTTMLVNVDTSFSSVEVSGLPQQEDQRTAPLSELVRFFADVAVPIVSSFVEPASAVATLPDAWLGAVWADMVEWVLLTGDQETASRLIVRCCGRALRGEQTWEARLTGYQRGWDLAGRLERPKQPPLGPEAMGWLARTHGLVGPDDLVPPAP